MKKNWSDFRLSRRVYDRWYPEIAGRIVKVLKTRIQIAVGGEIFTYDRAHACTFLEFGYPA